MKRWSIIAPGSRPSRMGTGTEHQRLAQAIFACALCGTPTSKHRYPLTQAEVDPFHQGGMGFDHGAGHPLLFPNDAKAYNCRNNNWLKNLGNYSEWPKVAGAVINAHIRIDFRRFFPLIV